MSIFNYFELFGGGSIDLQQNCNQNQYYNNQQYLGQLDNYYRSMINKQQQSYSECEIKKDDYIDAEFEVIEKKLLGDKQ